MKTLLLADGSRDSLASAAALTRWFGRRGLEVHVLSVAPRRSARPHRTRWTRRVQASRGREEARAWLGATAFVLREGGLRARTHLRSGNPREVAVRWAQRDFDLVVVGARGQEPTPFFDVGGVALSVLEHAPSHVLLVRDPEAEPLLASARDAPAILVAVDDGLHSRRVLDQLPRLLRSPASEAEVLSVADRGSGGVLGRRDARRVSRHAATVLTDHGIRTRPRVEAGPAAAAILEAAAEVDLLVLGSRAVERVEERHLGSVALEVARSARCSVLVLRKGHSGIALGRGVEEPGRGLSFQVAWRDVRPSRRVERQIARAVETVESLAPHALHLDVVVDRRPPGHGLGNRYRVRLELARPAGHVHVTRTPPRHVENETLVSAVEGAFRQLRRQLLGTGVEARAGGDTLPRLPGPP